MINVVEENYLMEMARIGWIPINNKNSVEVYVHTNDNGKIPHFHVRKYGKDNKFDWETCIKYTDAEYFSHGNYNDKLPNKSIAKELNKMLKSSNSKDPGRTYWQTAIVAWNNNNSDVELPFDLEQPDYTKL